ncbi:cytoplasmic protein [Kwoniella heveanensis CBS 569]|nr:cytoplasmic protein [Kwoniella heveanensis CBS 569]
MSRPAQPASRASGSAKPASNPGPTPAGSSPANIPRRNPGTLPGLARTASSLRQGTPLASSSSPLASLPAHLRNLSAPRIPSPLGKGTPARGTKQSLPVRTSKTTERHVLLPEDPQLAPLPKSPMGSQVNLVPPPKVNRESRHQASSSITAIGPSDERSDAEKMTKREREENKLPRLTAYATAEGYRLRLLQAFLKREHGVGVVRVFDDCVYAVYNLPLLPGYGASTKIRSSPAVKSPGGVSLLERMTMAEDLGYNDSYFPREDPSEATPAEYILSNSPPSHIPHEMLSNMDIPAGEEEIRESEIEAVREHLETSDGSDEKGLDLRAEEEAVGFPPRGSELGTHMNPGHPGRLEHVPAPALSPGDLANPLPDDSAHTSPEVVVSHAPPHSHSEHPSPTSPTEVQHSRYQHPSRLPKPKRRKSHSTQNVAEAVFFSYGVSVFFGFNEMEEREIMEDCEMAGTWTRGLEEDDWEVEEFHYVYDPDAEQPRIYNDMFTFKSRSHLFKLSLAHAIAQSNKLSIYESVMQETLSLTASFPKELSTTGHLQLTRREALKMTGRMFKLRMDVNLIGGILDTPELFWSEASLFPLYEAIHEYLEIGPRVQVLNDRLAVAGDLLEIIHEYIEERATHRITWIIIWLIVVACFVEAGEVIARLVLHAVPRETGEFMLLKAPKLLLANTASGSGSAF